MKALSVWQPYASLIVYGKKFIETRSWALRHRGPLLIHASKIWKSEQKSIALTEPFRTDLVKIGTEKIRQARADYSDPSSVVPLGCLIGMVKVIGCYSSEDFFIKGQGKNREIIYVKDGDKPKGIDLGNRHNFDLIHISQKEYGYGDFSLLRYGFIFDNPIAFKEPIPYRGCQGLFEVPDELVSEYLS